MWIKAVLQHHSSFLMSVPELRKKMAILYSLLSSRAASYKRIMKLYGRLDLILTHARSIGLKDVDFTQAQTPLLEVDEGGYEEEESMEEEQSNEEEDSSSNSSSEEEETE